MDSTSQAVLAADSDTLSPLPDVLHQGLTVVAVLACLSFAATTLTLFYLTYKLIRWHIKSWRASRRAQAQLARTPTVDLNLGLAEQHFGGNGQRGAGYKKKSPNQFLVLIYNLLIADIHQSMAFLLNAVWVSKDAIEVGTMTCKAQGWFVSTGDLASSCFILLIAIHTYLTVVWKHKPPQWALYTAVAGAWIFDYAMATIGIAATGNGRTYGGFYVRAAAWCWINVSYENLRLVTHYLFIFIALAVTSVLYTLIFLNLKRGEQQTNAQEIAPRTKPSPSFDFRPPSVVDGNNSNAAPANPTISKVDAHSGGRHPAFLLYPIIYVVCTAPLALGRVATMAGAKVPLSYFCVAGALITSNGWLDVLLWGWTRGELLFTAEVDTEDVGIETFAFMRTPHGRQFGNMVWVEGGGRGEVDQDELRSRRKSTGSGLGGWLQERMGWRRLGRGNNGSDEVRRGRLSGQARSISQESLRGAASRNDMAIQMDMVTSVVVEVDPQKHHERDPRTRFRQPSEASLSVNSAEKDLGPSRH
ncbi:hypothetical protein GQ53DRAFT_839786 [Thozetella sp. PMI_491]|nr:hypothetical protein GQ53DRAFT_839786 [Thozetella sp. PMI_491]